MTNFIFFNRFFLFYFMNSPAMFFKLFFMVFLYDVFQNAHIRNFTVFPQKGQKMEKIRIVFILFDLKHEVFLS